MSKNICYFVLPCFNEQEVLPITAPALLREVKALQEKELIAPESKILFIDDGSKDKTWAIIEDLHKQNPAFIGLKLSANRGHQNALLAGLMYAKDKADITISLDADLQDDLSVLKDFVVNYNDGCDIVYGVRRDRSTDTAFKRMTAEGFYKFMSILGVDIISNHADYRLMSKAALEALAQYKEVNLFLRGIIPCLGFKTGIVKYSRAARAAGETKYPLAKMLRLAFEGISSFSVRPIRIISIGGVIISFISLLFLVWFFVCKIAGIDVERGWTSLICSIWLLGGLNLLCIGIVGEYIGKIYQETKARPRYIIHKILDQQSK